MAPRKITKSKKELAYILIIVILVIALIAVILYKGDLLSILGDWNHSQDDTLDNQIYTSFYSKNTNIELPADFDIGSLMEIHFIDIGQGDSIFIRFPDQSDMLIDAGSGTTASNATKTKFSNYLTNMGISDLDYLLITHPDSDHVNLASIVLDNYQVNNIYYNNIYEGQSQTYRNFIDLVLLEGAQLFAIGENGAYYYFQSDEYNYRMDIYAYGYGGTTDPNEMSICCLLQYQDIKILFTGDALESTEYYLMQQLNCTEYSIDILKVAHHGSNSSTSQDFLDFFSPDYAVISVGQTNAYNHPSPFTMNRLFDYGVVTYRTNRHGNIVLYIDKLGNFAFLPEKNVAVENNSNEKDEKRLFFSL